MHGAHWTILFKISPHMDLYHPLQIVLIFYDHLEFTEKALKNLFERLLPNSF